MRAGCTPTLFHLIYRPTDEIELKIFDFSATAVAERWQTGARDMKQALRLLDGQRTEPRAAGVHVHQIG